MTGATVDAVLGLFLLYLVLSLAASSVQEWIASLAKLRSRNLRSGVERLFGRTYAQKVYSHPLIARLAKPGKEPSYVEPDTFATALLDVVARDDEGQLQISARDKATAFVGHVSPNSPLYETIRTIAEQGGGGIDELRAAVASWIDEGMRRISGWYARRAKLNVLVIASVLTVGANASTVHVITALGSGEPFRASLAEMAATVAASRSDPAEASEGVSLGDFPIGWENVDHSPLEWVERVVGWLITIAAVSLGAPFWFDLLGRVANLRGAGRKR